MVPQGPILDFLNTEINIEDKRKQEEGKKKGKDGKDNRESGKKALDNGMNTKNNKEAMALTMTIEDNTIELVVISILVPG